MATEGTKENPWKLKTPPLSSDYEMWRDEKDGTEVIICMVATTKLIYDARIIKDAHAMLKKHGDWMEMASADEQKPAKDGSLEAWGRDENNPIGGWYGMRKGYRGRMGMYLPSLLERLGLCEITHEKRGNRIKAL